jgi:hypothetical protein
MARLGDRVGSKLVRRSFPAVFSPALILPAAHQIPMTDHVLARLSDGNSKIVLQVQSACLRRHLTAMITIRTIRRRLKFSGMLSR